MESWLRRNREKKNIRQWTHINWIFNFLIMWQPTCFFCVLFEHWSQHLSTSKDVLRVSHYSTHRPLIFFFFFPSHPNTSDRVNSAPPPAAHHAACSFLLSDICGGFLFFPPSPLLFLSRVCFIATIDAARAQPWTHTHAHAHAREAAASQCGPSRRGRLTNSPRRAQTSLLPTLPTCRASRCVAPLISQTNRRGDVWMERGCSSSVLGDDNVHFMFFF